PRCPSTATSRSTSSSSDLAQLEPRPCGGGYFSRHTVTAPAAPRRSERGGGAEGGSAHRGEGVLRVEVLVDALEPALTTETRLLDAAEGGCGVRHDAHVEPHHARLELVDHALPAREILREDVRHEPVLGVVRATHGVLFVTERRDGEHGAE